MHIKKEMRPIVMVGPKNKDDTQNSRLSQITKIAQSREMGSVRTDQSEQQLR